MSGRSTRASLAAEAATTQLETIDVRLQRTEETQERMAQILVEVSEFMRAAQAPGLGKCSTGSTTCENQLSARVACGVPAVHARIN